MITVLERQHVSRRVPPSAVLRAQSVSPRWRNEEAASPRPEKRAKRRRRPEREPFLAERSRTEHSFLKGQLIRRTQRRAALKTLLRTKEAISRQETARPVREPGPLAAAAGRLIRSPWLLVGAAAAAGLLVAAFAVAPGVLSSFTIAGLSLPRARPVLPQPADVDPALYGLAVPEQAAPPAGAANAVLLSTLKVARYTAQRGDTISRIASRFKLNVDTIVSWNDIRDARALHPGMALEVPNRDGLRYVVRRGDTLQSIARAWGVGFNDVLDANMLESSVITVGQALFLPGARMNPTVLNRVLGSLFIYPVQGRISSWFGQRPDPFTGIRNYHNGVDIVNVVGTPILAAMAGRVADTGFNYNYGYYVILQHQGGYQTLYGHMTRFVVRKSQKVGQGEKIGELGTTGYSTGPHVHFSVFQNGQPVDPMRFLK
jgi:murein DD-endopeptidase MepM/ murein hydrolase activator NlpD